MRNLINKKLSRIMSGIKQRCENSRNPSYKYYGGKGVKVKITREELLFIWERDKAIKLKKPSIDRIDPNGHYELNNCRFIEISENVRRQDRKWTTNIPLLDYWKDCEYCHKSYQPIRKIQKYCSYECYNTAKMRRFWLKKLNVKGETK